MGSHTTSRPLRASADDVRRALDAIRRIVQAIRVASRAAERATGLSGAQLFVLQKLAEGEAASLNDLAARTLTHQSSVSVVVQKLVEQQLVARTASAADGRRVVLSLTAEGKAVVRKSPQAAQERLIVAVEALSPGQRADLARLLERVADGATRGDGRGDRRGDVPPMLLEDGATQNGRKKR